MDREEIEQIAQDGESETIELKKSTGHGRGAVWSLGRRSDEKGGQ
jgi:hypothetical protein